MDEACTLFSDFASGQAVAEACAMDLIRATAVCPESASMIRLLEQLRSGFRVEVSSQRVLLLRTQLTVGVSIPWLR